MDELTLRRARRGNEAAFEALVTPHEAMLWRICWRYTHSTPDAQDCLQETMVKAWRALPAFRGDSSIETWLYRLCVSCCIDYIRARARRKEESADAMSETGFDPADPSPQPEEAVLRREKQRQVHQAILALPDGMRETVILVLLEGRGYEEAAALTGTSVGTVKSRISRARQKLLAALHDERRHA
ncbi:MAG: sigma-70 family RNA polymerase sigma factor [Clostridia bacterium]|nr:sigma-70 family RNA polymerase sigma factor [Clostridia bacterium]